MNHIHIDSSLLLEDVEVALSGTDVWNLAGAFLKKYVKKNA